MVMMCFISHVYIEFLLCDFDSIYIWGFLMSTAHFEKDRTTMLKTFNSPERGQSNLQQQHFIINFTKAKLP